MASTIKVDKIEGSTGSTITVPTGQTFTVTDGIGVAGGGTGLTGFTAGDVLYATGTTTLAKLAKGTAEQVLAMNSGATAPDWGSVDLTVLPTITVAKGGTNLSSFTAGDILYATGTTTLAKLAKGGATEVLAMNSGATAPEWVAAAGGAWTSLKTITVSDSDTEAIFLNGTDGVVIDGTYDTYKVMIDGLTGQSSANWYLYCQVYDGGTDGTGTSLVTASEYDYASRSQSSHGVAIDATSNDVAFMKLPTKEIDSGTGKGLTCEFTAGNVNQVAAENCYKYMYWSGSFNDAPDAYLLAYFGGGQWKSSTNTIRGFKFYPSTSSFGAGAKMTLYGIT